MVMRLGGWGTAAGAGGVGWVKGESSLCPQGLCPPPSHAHPWRALLPPGPLWSAQNHVGEAQGPEVCGHRGCGLPRGRVFKQDLEQQVSGEAHSGPCTATNLLYASLNAPCPPLRLGFPTCQMEELQTQTRNVGVEGHLGSCGDWRIESVQLHSSQLFPEAKTLKPGCGRDCMCIWRIFFYFQMLANFGKNSVWVKKEMSVQRIWPRAVHVVGRSFILHIMWLPNRSCSITTLISKSLKCRHHFWTKEVSQFRKGELTGASRSCGSSSGLRELADQSPGPQRADPHFLMCRTKGLH